MHHGAFFEDDMAERKKYDPGLQKVGELIKEKRLALGGGYKSRDNFIARRSIELFDGQEWISLRHLSNLELGNNWISIEKLLVLAAALEQDPIDFFSEIVETYNRYKVK